MTFTEWYKEMFGREWLESYADLYIFAERMSNNYKEHCEENNIEPTWNG